MKTHWLILMFCAFFSAATAQRGEFKIYDNGLIYDDTTVQYLNVMVDSLNLVYKTCDLDQDYYAYPQTFAHRFVIEGNVEQVKRDLEKDLPFAELEKRYPGIEIEENLLITRYETRYRDEEPSWKFQEMPVNYGYGLSIYWPKSNEQPTRGSYVYKQYDQTTTGLYFIDDLQQKKLSDRHARMVQYVDCMVDTSAQIILDDMYEEQWELPKTMKSARAFLTLVNDYPGHPKYPEKDIEDYNDSIQVQAFDEAYAKYWQELDEWLKQKETYITQELSKTQKFKTLLREAIQEIETNRVSSEELEYYLGKYYSKEKALELKRNRRVVGFCSQDSRPREHAMQIAVLAAEAAQWDIFLRAHLNIMNDRFERVSDGSYAWGERQTYIRELEVLGFDVPQLLIGSCLAVANTSEGHYWGNVRRIGRALAEAQEREKVEKIMLELIQDDQLDAYNRMLVVYLYRNYIHSLPEEERQPQWDQLSVAAEQLPKVIAEKIEFGK